MSSVASSIDNLTGIDRQIKGLRLHVDEQIERVRADARRGKDNRDERATLRFLEETLLMAERYRDVVLDEVIGER